MKKKVKLLLIIILLVVMVFGCWYYFKPKNAFDNLEYDIVVKKYYDRWSSVDPMERPIGGYSTRYEYVLINTVKKEKYSIDYVDIYVNEGNELDTVDVVISKITDEEIADAINNYVKLDNLKSVKAILAEDITEDYKVTISKD